MMRNPAHQTGQPGAAGRSNLIVKRLRRLFVWSSGTKHKIKLNILGPDPVSGAHRDHTLLDDNPCSG